MKAPSPNRQRLMSLDDGLVRLGPQTVHVDITNACNTDCVTCWDHSPHLEVARPVAWKRQRAEPAFVGALLDDIQSLGGLEAVVLSGMGEPFTHPDVYAIIEDVKRRGLHLTIITNLVAADVQRVIALDVDSLLIGVQGASEASYLAFHPSFGPGHWQRLQEQLGALSSRAGTSAGTPGRRRHKHVQVICAHNAHELVAMIELAHRFGAEQVNFKLASLRHGTEAVRITEGQRAALLEGEIARAEERAAKLDVAHNLPVLDAQVRAGGEATAPIDEIGCFLGYHYARVTVDRTALYCCNAETVVGQVSDSSPFSTLWRGPAWTAMRARLRGGDFFSGCWQCGKLNQNVKLSARFREVYGDERWQRARGGGGLHDGCTRRGSSGLRVLP